MECGEVLSTEDEDASTNSSLLYAEFVRTSLRNSHQTLL
jgi:hypothetical protein